MEKGKNIRKLILTINFHIIFPHSTRTWFQSDWDLAGMAISMANSKGVESSSLCSICRKETKCRTESRQNVCKYSHKSIKVFREYYISLVSFVNIYLFFHLHLTSISSSSPLSLYFPIFYNFSFLDCISFRAWCRRIWAERQQEQQQRQEQREEGRSNRSKAAAVDIPTTSRPTGKNIENSMKNKEFSDQKTNRIFLIFIFISRTETVKNSNSIC